MCNDKDRNLLLVPIDELSLDSKDGEFDHMLQKPKILGDDASWDFP